MNAPCTTTLHVKDGKDNAPGWIGVTASGHVYGYMYAGGNQHGNDGNVVFTKGEGPGRVEVRLAGEPRYRIEDIVFGDHGGQLSATRRDDAHWTIDDACDAEIQAYYKVVVRDTRNDALVPCDPVIINQAR